MLHERNFFYWLATLLGCLVVFLLIDSYLAPYGLAIVQVWAWWLSRRWRPPLPSWMVAVGLLVVFGVVLNLMTTLSLPLSLQVGLRWLVGLQIWWLGWRWAAAHTVSQTSAQSKNQVEIIKLVWLGILLLLGTLSILSLATWFIPAWHLLPDMNLLYATYGHSHLSVILVLFFPFVMLGDRIWPGNQSGQPFATNGLSQTGSKWWLVGVAAVIALMLGSFGRVALMVLTGQLVIMLGWLPKTDWSKRWLSGLAELALGCIVVALVWSSVVSRSQFCPVPVRFQTQLCKSIKTEPRPEYWRQAWVGIQQQPWLGTGFNTFGLISHKYRKEPGNGSGFVHNDFLQLIADAGLWGGLMALGLWVGWWITRPPGAMPTPATPPLRWFQWAVWLGLGGGLVNSLFDFDLQFTAVLWLTLGGLGALLGWWQAEKKVTAPSPSSKTGFQRRFWQYIELSVSAGITLVMVGWAVWFFCIDYGWFHGQKDFVWRWGLPYQTQSLLLVQDFATATPLQQQNFLQWYGSQPRILAPLITVLLKENHGQQTEQTRQLIAQLHELDPWSRLEHETVTFDIAQRNWSQAQTGLQDLDTFFVKQYNQFGIPVGAVDDRMRWQMASQSAQLAAVAFDQADYPQGVALLHQTARYEPWAIDYNPRYCQTLLSSVGRQAAAAANNHVTPVSEAADQLRQQLSPLNDLDPKYFDSCQTELAKVALLQLQRLNEAKVCKDKPEACEWWRQAALRWSSSSEWVQKELSDKPTF